MLPTNQSIQENKYFSKLIYSKSYYSTSFSDNISFSLYEKFKNWIVGEFDLFFKEENHNSLNIYFPNGIITIEIKNNTKISIIVKNKNSKKCKNMMQKVLKLYLFSLPKIT